VQQKLQKDIIVKRLREQGCRITKQRLMLLDVILEGECSSCKEILYKASKLDRTIGTATVYRMINTLEEIGAISRKNMYKVACGEECLMKNACMIELDDDTVIELSKSRWNQIIQKGLESYGYLKGQRIRSVVAQSCE